MSLSPVRGRTIARREDMPQAEWDYVGTARVKLCLSGRKGLALRWCASFVAVRQPCAQESAETRCRVISVGNIKIFLAGIPSARAISG